MMVGAQGHYDGIVVVSQTNFTEDLKKITIPVLVIHGDDDQISAPFSAKLLKNNIQNLQRLSSRNAHDRGRHH